MHQDAARLERNRAVVDAINTALREVGGPELYRRNAFRITGVPTGAGRAAVSQHKKRVMPALRAGADVDLGSDLQTPADEVGRAFDRILEDPRRRLVDELFWVWGEPDGTCGCTKKLHADHDAAVLAHSAVLDLEAGAPPTDDQLDEAEDLWTDAARLWDQVLRRAAFWDHVRHRIVALDERQLDESVIDVLREQVPITLVRPLVVLAVAADGVDAGWLADQARQWPVPARVVDDQLDDVTNPLYDEVENVSAEARDHCQAGRPARAAAMVYDQVLPKLEKLTALMPPDRYRRTATARDRAGTVLNNSAMALFDQEGSSSGLRVKKWLGSAKELAADPHTIAAVDSNRDMLDDALAALKQIREQVDQLVDLGRVDLARTMLQDIKLRLRGSAGSGEIDRMLANLPSTGTRRPATFTPPPLPPLDPFEDEDDDYYRYVPPPPRQPSRAGRIFGGVVATLLVGAVFVGVLFLIGSVVGTPVETVSLYSEARADNAAVGTCIGEKRDWEGDLSKVLAVACGREHWGEVLGYVSLGAVPSPYPGQDQTYAIAQFECRQLLALQDLREGYAVSHTVPGEDVWNDGGKRYENYATCVVHRADDKPLPEGRLTVPGVEPRDVAVWMGMFHAGVWENPPVGTCVQDQRSYRASVHDVPIVDCAQPHWAEIIGYPPLYEPGTTWPGDAAVYAAARKACGQVAADRGVPSGYRVDLEYPGEDWWKNPKQRMYAICTVARADDGTFSGELR